MDTARRFTLRPLLVPLAALVLGQPSPASAEDPKIRIVLAGDSTVTDNAGWGGAFRDLLGDDVVLCNLAKSGRSSASFRREGLWAKVLAEKPDVILIQFGHNDSHSTKDGGKVVPAAKEYRENLRGYIKDARAAGARPILVSPMERRFFEPGGKVRPTLADYARAAAAVAKETNTPLVDLNARSIALYESLGEKPSDDLSLDGGKDRSHFNAQGGQALADELKKADPKLAPYFK